MRPRYFSGPAEHQVDRRVQGAARLDTGRQQDVHVQRLEPEPVREPVNPVLRRAARLQGRPRTQSDVTLTYCIGHRMRAVPQLQPAHQPRERVLIVRSE
jgi:hypothetical protein